MYKLLTGIIFIFCAIFLVAGKSVLKTSVSEYACEWTDIEKDCAVEDSEEPEDFYFASGVSVFREIASQHSAQVSVQVFLFPSSPVLLKDTPPPKFA